MTDSATSTVDSNTTDSRHIDAEARTEGNDKADAWAIIIIFTSALLMAVHFVSGWTFDWLYDLL